VGWNSAAAFSTSSASPPASAEPPFPSSGVPQGFDIRLEIDGGVTVDNIKEVAEAGVDMFVAGSAILKAPRTQDAYRCAVRARAGAGGAVRVCQSGCKCDRA
jgi:hypothetical protein